VDPRQHLQALQAEVAAARAAFSAGDRTKALQHLDQALSIDPSFLAAQSLRERVLAGPLGPAAPARPPAPPPPNVPAHTSARLPPKRLSSKEAYERIELRARQRRVDHCIAATRAALGRQQPEAAAAALAELIALEPDESNVASLSAELADLRRRFAKRPLGVRVAAAAAFLAVAGTASWVERPRRPTTVAVERPAAEQTTAPIEVARLESHLIAPPFVKLPPDLTPSLMRRVPDTVRDIPATVRGIPDTSRGAPATPSRPPTSEPTRTAPAVAATAPLSLPTPLSQLPPAGTPPPNEAPRASLTVGPSVAATPPIRPPSDRDLVEEALQRYRGAYGRLNVQSAQAVYPTVNRVALARAFDGLESQSLTFDSCDVEVRGVLARAICHGTARYVPKIGNRYPHAEPLVWSFELRKSDDDWTIYYAKASR
jgi:tetratricopeptide (TPR) repeat protein